MPVTKLESQSVWKFPGIGYDSLKCEDDDGKQGLSRLPVLELSRSHFMVLETRLWPKKFKAVANIWPTC